MDKKIQAACMAGTFVVGALGGAFVFPTEVEKEVIKEVEVMVEVPGPTEIVTEYEEVEVVKNVTVEVPVDNGNLDVVLEGIYDNDGDVEFITDDLDNDEVDKIVDRFVEVKELKELAVDAVKDELFDELDGEVVSGEELDEDDMERLRIDDEYDEVVISDADFDDGDFSIVVTGRFEQDDVKYEFEAELKFKDGEFDEFDSIDVNLV